MSSEDILAERAKNATREGLEQTGLYHSIRLPDGRLPRGAMDMEYQEQRLASFRLPEDLSGRRVLDVGPWDGYFTFEMERRGAEVTGIDCVDQDTFREWRRLMGSKARYEQMEVYEIDPRRPGAFDIVLFLGVLYHLKYPPQGLEKICAVTRDVCIIDTVVVDGAAWLEGKRPPIPVLEFYERNELAGQFDNWYGPTVSAVEALARAAGFARTEVLFVNETPARIAAYRKWGELPAETERAVEAVALTSHAHPGRCFESSKEEYVELWCRWERAEAPGLDEVFPEVDGLGVAVSACNAGDGGLLVSFRVPPGLAPGRHGVRVRMGRAGWSNEMEMLLDLAPAERPVVIAGVRDGIRWTLGETDWGAGGWLTLWTTGLTAEADPGNTVVRIGDVPHYPRVVVAETGQVNVELRPIVREGVYDVVVVHRGMESAPAQLTVTGRRPGIKGLEV